MIPPKRQEDLNNSKEPRFFFSEKQVQAMKKVYRCHPYPDHSLISKLAEEVNTDWKCVRKWFANQRARVKKMQTQRMNYNSKFSSLQESCMNELFLETLYRKVTITYIFFNCYLSRCIGLDTNS